jgi:hypothetical protein
MVILRSMPCSVSPRWIRKIGTNTRKNGKDNAMHQCCTLEPGTRFAPRSRERLAPQQNKYGVYP